MGICPSADGGSIRCRETTRLMREQNHRNARQPANGHRAYVNGRLLIINCLFARC